MDKNIALIAATCVLAGHAATANAVLITLEEFTGDDTQMLVEILDSTGGVTAEWSFAAGSANLGDITGVWLGITDTLFDPLGISAADVSVLTTLPTGVSYVVTIAENLGGDLPGEKGYALLFDFDLGLTRTHPGDLGIDNLLIRISTADLLADYFDAAGARLQSVGASGQGSSKLAGTRIVTVPEPATLSLLGGGLLLLGVLGGRRRPGAALDSSRSDPHRR